MAHPQMFSDDDPVLARVEALALALPAASAEEGWDEVAELLDASCRRTAPVRLVTELDAR